MKKTVRLVGFLLVSMLCFTACSSDDDDDYTELIVGTWQMTHSEGWLEDEYGTETWDDSYGEEDEEEYYTFNADGSGEYKEIDGKYSHTESFTWEINKNQLTVIDERGDEEIITIKGLSSTKLVTYYKWDDKEYNEKGESTDTFKRVE